MPPCPEHDWLFDSPCPKCPTPVGESPPAPKGSPFDIPPFLQRNPDNTFAQPEASHGADDNIHSGNCDFGGVGTHPDSAIKPLSEWAEPELLTALEDASITVVDRQPIILEMRRREDKAKSYARLSKARLLKSGQDE